MNKIILVTVCIMSMLVYAGDSRLSVAGEPPERVVICHIPPDDPTNFHTITVSEKSLPAHLSHNDILGSCNDYCEQLCDDINPCTVDTCLDDRGGCTPTEDREPVDCDDSVGCTDDYCDLLTGCMNIPNDNLCPWAHYCDPIEECLMTECPCYGETNLNGWYVTLSGCEGGCEVICADNLHCPDCIPSGFTSVFSGACTSGEHIRYLYLLYVPNSPGGTFCNISIPEDQIYFRTYLTDEQIKACREILLNSNLWSLCP